MCIYICMCVYVSRIIYVYLHRYLQVKAPLDCCSAREAAWKKPHITTSIYTYKYVYIYTGIHTYL